MTAKRPDKRRAPTSDLRPTTAPTVIGTTGRKARAFLASAIPLSAEITEVCRPLLEPLLSKFPTTWPYCDRVLALVMPSYRSDIDRFHRGDGQPMRKLHASLTLKEIDKSCMQALWILLEQISPQVKSQLAAASDTATGTVERLLNERRNSVLTAGATTKKGGVGS